MTLHLVRHELQLSERADKQDARGTPACPYATTVGALPVSSEIGTILATNQTSLQAYPAFENWLRLDGPINVQASK